LHFGRKQAKLTFRFFRWEDEAKFYGDYRTKHVIREIYDALATAMQTGKAYQTRLNPAPASLAVAHPWGWEDKPLELPAVLRVPLPESWHYVVNIMLELLWQAVVRCRGESSALRRICFPTASASPDLGNSTSAR